MRELSRKQMWFGWRGRCEHCGEIFPQPIHVPPPAVGICYWTNTSESIKWGIMLSHQSGLGPHFYTYFLSSLSCVIFHFYTLPHSPWQEALSIWQKQGRCLNTKMMSKIRAKNPNYSAYDAPKPSLWPPILSVFKTYSLWSFFLNIKQIIPHW